jgi:hypothetical protein
VLSAGSKLHVSHNNYLLALNEYNAYRNLVFEKLFPNLLATHQEMEERILEELYLFSLIFYHLIR